MESQVALTASMVQICREKTFSKKHTSESLSDTEKTQFSNCLMKFFETPNHVMSAVQGGMQGGSGF